MSAPFELAGISLDCDDPESLARFISICWGVTWSIFPTALATIVPFTCVDTWLTCSRRYLRRHYDLISPARRSSR